MADRRSLSLKQYERLKQLMPSVASFEHRGLSDARGDRIWEFYTLPTIRGDVVTLLSASLPKDGKGRAEGVSINEDLLGRSRVAEVLGGRRQRRVESLAIG